MRIRNYDQPPFCRTYPDVLPQVRFIQVHKHFKTTQLAIPLMPKDSIYASLHDGGSLALFAGLNLLAFVLVFLFVEETKRRSLEDLDLVFAVRKRDFVRHQVSRYLPWFFRRYALGRAEDKPSLYVDLIWNGPRTQSHFIWGDEEVTEERRGGGEGGGGGGGVSMGDDWNGFASNSGQAYGGEENVSPSSLRRPSGLVIPDYTARISEDSDDSAHR